MEKVHYDKNGKRYELTSTQVSEMFNVSRTTVHHWKSPKKNKNRKALPFIVSYHGLNKMCWYNIDDVNEYVESVRKLKEKE